MGILARIWGRFRSPSVLGHYIGELQDVQFAPVSSIPNARFEEYSTCRGPKSQAECQRVFDLLLDASGAASEDDILEAECEGLYDWFMHQYTMYSVTPIAIYYVINKYTKEQIDETAVKKFLKLCHDQGTRGIWLTNKEIRLNRAGKLPMFKIEEVMGSI